MYTNVQDGHFPDQSYTATEFFTKARAHRQIMLPYFAQRYSGRSQVACTMNNVAPLCAGDSRLSLSSFRNSQFDGLCKCAQHNYMLFENGGIK
jgi:hypothetical protein